WPNAAPVLVEDKANGPAILSALRNTVRGMLPVEPRGSKEARAAAVQPFVAAGNVYLPHPTRLPWVSEFIAEARSFPLGTHDDQVDAFSQALSHQWLTASAPTGSLDLGLRELTQESGWIQ
ncbi:MAG: phage terminase large subunit, partial [Gemmatimonadales bacterium]|nr:phage terminase large subunit [Gemmatimonadales bacterium]